MRPPTDLHRLVNATLIGKWFVAHLSGYNRSLVVFTLALVAVGVVVVLPDVIQFIGTKIVLAGAGVWG